MSSGKYFSLEEARKTGKIDRFCKEHPSKVDAGRFQGLLDAMVKGSPKADQTSGSGASEDYSGTQTRPDTSEDASD